MQNQEPNEVEEDKAALNTYSKYSSIVIQMIVIIGLFAFIGYRLDAWQKNDPMWITALFCVTGVCLSIYQTVRQLR